MKIKSIIFFLFILFAVPVLAHEEDLPINSSSELREWCREESEAYFVGKGVTPYNWSASYWDKGNTLFVKGNWRVDGKDIIVECRIAKGAKRKYANLEFINNQ